MLVKFATIAGGVFIEQTDNSSMEYDGSERCFRFDEKGNSEYTFLRDLRNSPDHARWYGHAYKAKDFLFA